jgi:hypothetical protein
LTGFATPQQVQAAILAGAWDYMEKNAGFIDHLLPLRVRHAVEAARERRLRHMAPGEVERQLRESWRDALTESNHQRKGRLLEETIQLLFRSIPGLHETALNKRSTSEEFDVVVTNNSTDPVLGKEGSFFLVECKNWSRSVEPEVLDYFRSKLKDRFGRCQLGILIGIAGFTRGVLDKLARWNNEPQLILLLDREAVASWLDATDRLSWLKNRIQQSALRA